MKSEKHVDTANEIFEYLYEHVEAPSFVHEGDNWKPDVKKKIISALQQVEHDALASKVVGPSDEDQSNDANKQLDALSKKEIVHSEFSSGYMLGHARCFAWYRSQLTLAPTEPEVKAQGFEGLDYNSETLEIKYKGKVIGKWDNEAIYNYPEDLTWDRDIGSFAAEMFQAGQKSQAAKLRLPDDFFKPMHFDHLPKSRDGRSTIASMCAEIANGMIRNFYEGVAVKSMNEGGE